MSLSIAIIIKRNLVLMVLVSLLTVWNQILPNQKSFSVEENLTQGVLILAHGIHKKIGCKSGHGSHHGHGIHGAPHGQANQVSHQDHDGHGSSPDQRKTSKKNLDRKRYGTFPGE